VVKTKNINIRIAQEEYDGIVSHSQFLAQAYLNFLTVQTSKYGKSSATTER